MGKDIDEQQLLAYLVEFVTGMPIQCDRIRLVDLYGNKMPSQLFDTTTINHYHYVFTQLKKTKAGKGKLFNRRFVGGAWKGTSSSIPVYNKETSVFGFKKTFRFDEKHQSWYMTEYHLTDKILEDLRLRGQIRYEEFVVCRIRRNVNSNHIRENFLASSSSQGQETVKSFAQENQDLGQSSAANVIPSDELNSQVSLLPKESNVIQLPASIDEECSVPVVHQETPSASLLAKESNVPAAIEQEECSIHVVHQETLSVSLLVKESNVPASIDEECSVPVDHQETPPVSFVAKESNVPAEIEEECSVPQRT